MLLAVPACFLSSLPSILAINGAVFGTLTSTILPIVFFNRAFSGKSKHLMLDRSNRHNEDLLEDYSPFLNPLCPPSEIEKPTPDLVDGRRGIKVVNALVLLAGVVVSGVCLYYSV